MNWRCLQIGVFKVKQGQNQNKSFKLQRSKRDRLGQLQRKKIDFWEEKNSHSGAGEGTRTLTPKAPEPKSGASTNFATPAY